MEKHGSHSLSRLAAIQWRRILSSFKQGSIQLCKTTAKLANLIATTEINADYLTSYCACPPIAFVKKSGVRPIIVRDVLRRRNGRSFRTTWSCQAKAINDSWGKMALDTPFTLRSTLEKPHTEAMLLIDSKNAYCVKLVACFALFQRRIQTCHSEIRDTFA